MCGGKRKLNNYVMKPIDLLFDELAGGDALLGWLVLALALACFLAGSWLWLDSLTYVRRRRAEERAMRLRCLQMELDDARDRAGLARDN